MAAKRLGSELEQAGGADEGLQAGALIEEERARPCRRRRAGMREGGEEEFAEEGVCGGAGDVALDLRAGVFDELVVLDAGGAGGHAGHAAEALVHVECGSSGRGALRPGWLSPSCRCGRGASPSPRPRGRRWGRREGRSRSGRSRRGALFRARWCGSKELGLAGWISVSMVVCWGTPSP